MELIFTLIIIGLVVASIAAATAWAYVYQKKTKERLAAIAAELGLEYSDGRDIVAGAEFQASLSGPSSPLSPESPAFSAETSEKVKALFAGAMKVAAPWRLSGTYEGVRVEVYPETRSSGKSSTTYTVMRAFVDPPLAFDLKLAREGFFTKLGKAIFSIQDVEIGDPEFDAAARVKSSDPEAARSALSDPEAKAAILDLLGLSAAARMDGSCAYYEAIGVSWEAKAYAKPLATMARAARSLGGR